MSQEELLQNNPEKIPGEGGSTEGEPGNEEKKKPIWPWILGIFVVLVIGGLVLLGLSLQTTQTAEDDSWERVKLAGVLRVATSADYPPFSYYNQDFVIDGYDPALIREITSKLGVQIEITDYAFESLNTVLENDQADVVIAAISVTPERDAVVDFSNVYFIGDDGILARSDSNLGPITDINQFVGLTTGVQRGSIYEAWAQRTLVDTGLISQNQLFSYIKPDQAVDDLKANRLNVVILDLQPAIKYLSDPELALVGERLNQQRYAVALPEGTYALQSVINQSLLELQNEGRLNQLAQDFLGLRPEDIIPPPTCVDSMEFVKDINLDDEDLTNFPEVNPGEAFQKGWQILNTGTCTWSGSYFINYVRGNDPADQMQGQPTVISGMVEPGETYDIFVNLVAPQQAGKFVGYWQMHNAESVPFGQTIWVAIQVPGTPPDPTEPTEPQPPMPTMTETEELPEPTETEQPPEPTEEPGSDLLEITWVLESYRIEEKDEELTKAIEDVDVLLTFEKSGTVSGNAGCNDYTGHYVTNGIEIIIEEIGNTLMYCEEPEGLQDQEDLFLQMLERVEEYRIVLDENDHEHLEMFIYVMEDNQKTEKVLLMFYDQLDGPPEN
ncbi:MAG: transporter substrate-binding domain-containing protein [Chloroflexota bacterium]|nr:transporter substrate-binding domain-containing protein [Chloroflexota bacterium]